MMTKTNLIERKRTMYEKKISKAEPGLIVIALDDSGSMAENLPGTTDPKYAWVERLYGVVLKEPLARSTEIDGDSAVVKPRYYTYNILYGSAPRVWASGLMDIEETVNEYAKWGNSLGLGGNMGGTHTEAAFKMGYDFLKEGVQDERFDKSYPAVFFHLSDGMAHTDALPIAEQIKNLQTQDGNVLVVNAFIGTETDLTYNGPEDFPGYVDITDVGSNEDNIRMFNMSSVVPETMRQNLIDDGIFPELRESARLFFDVRTKEMLKHVIQVVGSQGSRADRSVM